MLCQNCGKEVAQGTRFCINCGAQVQTQASAQPKTAPASESEAEKPAASKKKTNIWVILVVIAAAWLVGNFIGQGMTGGSGDRNPGASLVSSDGKAYEKIFTDANIAVFPAIFRTSDAAAYVMESSDGYIDHLQFGYEGDTIKEMVETIYMSVEGWSEAEVEAFDRECRANYAAAESLGFVSISYQTSYRYYSMTITLKNLDQTENIRSAVNVGLLSLTDSDVSRLSMSGTEKSLMDQGYVKK